VHLFSAIIFIGGSFFMWLVVNPVSRLLSQDESERTVIVGKIARRFGRVAIPALVILIISGLYNLTWYLSPSYLLNTLRGMLLFAKIIVVAVLVFTMYLHNVYFGKKIIELAREKRIEELQNLRKKSRIVSFTNLGIMVIILFIVVMMRVN
jgi:uncharacterized membrane protein